MVEVFCNTVVPMRMMLAVNPWAFRWHGNTPTHSSKSVWAR